MTTTTILYPGSATIASAAGAPSPDSGVVGVGPVLADGSDATYVNLRAPSGGQGNFYAPLPPLASVGIDPAGVTAVTLHARVSASVVTTGGTLPVTLVTFLTTSASSTAFPPDQALTSPHGASGILTADIAMTYVDGVIQDVSSAGHAWTNFAETVYTLSQADPWLWFGIGTGPEVDTSILSVYEAWVEVEWTGTGATYSAPATRDAAPLRQYPRNDGLASSSARRLYPRPGSYQLSNRRAGGYL